MLKERYQANKMHMFNFQNFKKSRSCSADHLGSREVAAIVTRTNKTLSRTIFVTIEINKEIRKHIYLMLRI